MRSGSWARCGASASTTCRSSASGTCERCWLKYARHYNGHRPHQGLQQEPPQPQPGHAIDITARIECRQVIGGLRSEYHRAA